MPTYRLQDRRRSTFPRIQYPNGFSTRIEGDDKARITTAGQSVEIGAAQSGPITVLIEPSPT